MLTPSAITGKRILFGCLDWGKGHFARSLPLIRQLEQQNNTVIYLGTDEELTILKSYGFNGMFVHLQPTGFRFRGDGNFRMEGFRNVIIVGRGRRRDTRTVRAAAHRYSADVVISDHRYGVYAPGLENIFITHQTNLPAGDFANRIHRKWMSRFQTIWIPDREEVRLAGKLSAPVLNSCYIGWLSRFELCGKIVDSGRNVAVVSGPEPYASQLVREIVRLAEERGGNWSMITSEVRPDVPEQIQQITDWKVADELMAAAGCIVSRCGYSTLMDIVLLKKRAVLFPTPGQREQLYLAELHAARPDWEFC